MTSIKDIPKLDLLLASALLDTLVVSVLLVDTKFYFKNDNSSHFATLTSLGEFGDLYKLAQIYRIGTSEATSLAKPNFFKITPFMQLKTKK